ncbi:hypothetical protein CALVIDRAFT_566630 [Calocera viscosa TUFC12733]|uniref:TECPR1-like DysF domain-containing protein n=1 Tax=Calocera viscosa (strain TUFC12733) TaxID=1330018 RepID=A0A167JAM7_CALVF|nr:hypothetical protein CALVIDRAFT_566630 [Calocera viscosa TUFC12733]
MPSPPAPSPQPPPPPAASRDHASSLSSSNSSSSSFLSTTPTPVLRFLTSYGPTIHALSWARDVWLWRDGRRSDALLVLAGWWGLCVGLGAFVRYALPLVLLYYLHPVALDTSLLSRIPFLHLPSSSATAAAAAQGQGQKRSPSLPPSSPASLSKTLSTLSLLPTPPSLPSLTSLNALADRNGKLEWPKALRAVGILYPLWLLVMWLTPLPIVLATAGTVLLTWNAPFCIAARHLLASSGLVAYLCARAWALLTGSPAPTLVDARLRVVGEERQGRRESFKSLKVAFGVTAKEDEKKPEEKTRAEEAEHLGEEVSVPPMRFRFDIWENQRWWMGLDWTSALLPSDPAPYTIVLPCTAPSPGASSAAPSPSTLPLPSPSQTVLPHPSNPSLQVVRKALWTWEDAEWRVLVHRDGCEPERVVMQLPELEGGENGAKGAKGRVEEVMKRARGRTGTAEGGEREGVPEGEGGEEEEQAGAGAGAERHEADGEETVTDENGWVFFDNKWQGRGSKGGMGKYTRSRRWSRIALCHETVEVVRSPSSARAASFSTSTSISPLTRQPSANPGLPTPTVASAAYPASATPYNLFSAFAGGPGSAPVQQAGATTAQAEVWARGELDLPELPKGSDVVGRRSLDSPRQDRPEQVRRDSLESYGPGHGVGGGVGHEERERERMGLRARLKGVVQKVGTEH